MIREVRIYQLGRGIPFHHRLGLRLIQIFQEDEFFVLITFDTQIHLLDKFDHQYFERE